MATAWHGRDSTSDASDAARRPVYDTEGPRTRSYSGGSTLSRRGLRQEQQDATYASSHSRGLSSSSGRQTALPSGYPSPPVPPIPARTDRYEGIVINRPSREETSSQRQRLFLTDDDEETDDAPRRDRKASSPSVREPSRGGNPPLLPFSYKSKDVVNDVPPTMPPVRVRDDESSDLNPLRSREEFLPTSARDPKGEDRVPRERSGATKTGRTRSTSTSPPDIAWSTKLYTISYLIFFSILGTLTRLGLQWLTFYPGAPLITPVLWANAAGSFVIGFLAEDQQLFSRQWLVAYHYASEKRSSNSTPDLEKSEKSRRKKTLPLYIGLATGLCGSITSFSSFARDTFLALSNDLPAPVNHAASAGIVLSTTDTLSRNGGYSFMAVLAVIFYTLALSLGGLILGAHLALALQPYLRPLSLRLLSRILDPLIVVLAFGCWLGAILLAIFPPDRPSGPASRGSWDNERWRGEVLFALVFAPIGCLLRYYISVWLNPISAKFPLGTFAVNIFGTAIEAMCYDLQHVGIGALGMAGGGRVGCQVLQGVMDGLCGCLTTISTWVAEIESLRRKHGYLYAVASVLVALAVSVVIMGPVRWTVGWNAPVCSTGYASKLYG